MTRRDEYLYMLLPALHRMRDEVRGGPLRELLKVIGEQVQMIEKDIDRLYDNWFIETCDDWVVPYLGDLVGYRTLADAGLIADPTTPEARRQTRALVPRRDVADTIANRRRKGTVALLEELAADVTGWSARVVEFYSLLSRTQHLDHVRPGRARTVDLREGERLGRAGDDTAFDDLAHTIDVRRPLSHHTRGRYSVQSTGLFVWRLGSYPVTETPAHCIEREGSHCYSFSVLGNDTQLFVAPAAEPNPTHVAEEINVPAPLRRRALEHRVSEHPLRADASPTYYGAGRSVWVTVQDWPLRGHCGVVPAESVIPADLSDWHAYRAPRDHVLLDPQRGRLVFPPGQPPRRVSVGYRYGFSADMGGGEYRRQLSEPSGALVLRVRQRGRESGEYRTIKQAWRYWREIRRNPPEEATEVPRAVVIEVADSSVYEERLVLDLEPGEYVQLRAAPRCRPVLRLLDYRVDQPDPLHITGGAAARFVLDGFLVTGRGLVVAGHRPGGDRDAEDNSDSYGDGSNGMNVPPSRGYGEEATDGPSETPLDAPEPKTGDLCDVTIRHCTLVPGWDLECDCSPRRRDEPSITLDRTRARLVVEHSIIGSIVVSGDERRGDPGAVAISDTILDATSPDRLAFSSDDGRLAYSHLTVTCCTVVGEVRAHSVELVENSIFTSPLRVARRQLGCVRYTYLPPGSRTPRRYHCQPDAGIANAGDDVRAAQAERLRPTFTSLRYGHPGYGQLADAVPAEIWRGADDEAELGAFHDLYQPQRAANLRVRLDEYTPAGTESGIYFTT
ncbi:hypothetical protein LR392_04925 [Arthrobacter sp. AK04]|uniref:hypothetical protein n=1 Tax=Arthrobacter sp. AK04 TaxID=2900048 RepID=UPI001E6500E9|nr:hypothetical protein [Arthrobacter sp. AK04]MCD5341571.1 hypothetical protein [Arthrobacter sp. AK04]